MRTPTTTHRPGAPATPELDSCGLGANAHKSQIPPFACAHNSGCCQASEVSTPPLHATLSFSTAAEGSDDAPAAAKPSLVGAASLVGAVGAAATLVGAFFRTRSGTVAATEAAPGSVDAAASGADAFATAAHTASDTSVRFAGPPPRLPPLRPLVLCSSSAAVVSAAGAPSTALAGWVLRCSAHGRHLSAPAAAPLAPHEPVQLLLPASGLNGVALVEPVPPAEAPHQHAFGTAAVPTALPSAFGVLSLPPGGSRPLLLLSDAAMTAELAGPLAALADASPRGAAAADCILLLLGNALQTTEHAPPPRVLAAAAAVAMSRGWLRTADALLSRVAARAGEDEDDEDALRCTDSAGGSLLHAAIRCGAPGAVAVLTSHAGFRGGRGRFGGAGSVDLAGTTPAHLAAAAMARGNPMPALVLAAADAAMPLAWLGARDATGATPSSSAGSGPATAVFSAAQAARLSAGSAAARAACVEAQAAEQWDARELQAEAGLLRLEGAGGDAAAVGRELLREALRALRAVAAPSYDSGAEGARCSDASGDDEADSGANSEEAAPAPSEGAAEYRAPMPRATPARRVVAWALRRARALLGHASRRMGDAARRIRRRRGVTRIATQSRAIQKHS